MSLPRLWIFGKIKVNFRPLFLGQKLTQKLAQPERYTLSVRVLLSLPEKSLKLIVWIHFTSKGERFRPWTRNRPTIGSRSRVFVDISEQILEPWQTCSGSCQNISWGSARIQFWTPLCGGNGGLRVHPWPRFLGHFLAAFSWPFSAPVLVYFLRPPWSEIKIF